MARTKKDVTPAAAAKTKKAVSNGKTDSAFPIVGLGASAGGLEAFEAFFKAMPSDSGMAFVLVAHLDPTHISLLPELLQKHTKMQVFQVEDGMQVRPDVVYVIPPNKDLNLFKGALQLAELKHPRGKVVFLGASLRHLTLKHHLEQMAGLPYAYHKAYFTPAYRDRKPLPLPFFACVRYLNGKVNNNDCSAFQLHLQEKEVLAEGHRGRAGIAHVDEGRL